MNTVKGTSGKINRNTLLALSIIILVFAIQAGTGVYFALKSKRLSLELKDVLGKQDARMREDSKVQLDLKNNYARIQNDYLTLQQSIEGLKNHRDKLVGQVRALLGEKERARKLGTQLGQTEKDMQALAQEKQDFLDQTLSLRAEIQDLGAIQKQLIAEKNQLEDTLTKERDKTGIKKLEQENLSLRKDNSELTARIRQYQDENMQIKNRADLLASSEGKLKDQVKQLTDKVNDFDSRYNEAMKKNKELQKQVMEAPRKFAELARQNKALIKQAATMHYNMGVFYTKEKDYSRAVAEFEKCLELAPDDAYAHFNLGYIYAEYMVNRDKAIEQFRQYLRTAKSSDKDVDWVKRYIITWESWKGNKTLE